MKLMWSLIMLGASLALTGGCGTSTVAPSLAASAPRDRLYLSLVYTGNVDVFSLPITGSSQPVASVVGRADPWAMEFDSTGRLFVANAPQTEVYAQPIIDGAQPALVVPATPPEWMTPLDVNFDKAGDLFVGGYTVTVNTCPPPVYNHDIPTVEVLSTPISGSSQLDFSITEQSVCGGPSVDGLAFDPDGNLWTAIGPPYAMSPGASRLDEFSPPFSNKSTPVASISMEVYAVRFDAEGDMYVSSGDGINVFKPPFGPSMTKAFSIAAGAGATGMAFDNSGNLYAVVPGTDTGGDLAMFVPPFGSASLPAVTIPGRSFGLGFSGVAIGP
jgi:hypothetical protein